MAYKLISNIIPTLSIEKEIDAVIIGGGLAGLALSIQLSKAGHKVVVVEKEHYPFHRVCGEYISLESWHFLERLGYPVSNYQLPIIKKLVLSAPNGKQLQHPLPLGGFGISRYKMDADLANLAKQQGVIIEEGVKVTGVVFENNGFSIATTRQPFQAKIVVGSFGKKSNIDVQWDRPFTRKKNNKLTNYVGIKYHVQIAASPDTITLHHFKDGYCGISKVENNAYCLCYLTTAKNLQDVDNSIPALEQTVLSKNPCLKKIFSSATFLSKQPVVISQISFESKTQVENHVLLVGDAAGMITPLCGNGMSMALHGSKLAADLIHQFLKGSINREHLEKEYARQWNKIFSNRLQAGRLFQKLLLGIPILSTLVITLLQPFPKLINWMIKQTHGESF
jgi:menaquinone-9 beta-reductase